MGWHTLLDLSHDSGPPRDSAELLDWARKMRTFTGSGDRETLPNGVTFLTTRHSSRPCPVRDRPRVSEEMIRIVGRQIARMRKEVRTLGHESPTMVGEIAALEGLVSTLRLLQKTDVHQQPDTD